MATHSVTGLHLHDAKVTADLQEREDGRRYVVVTAGQPHTDGGAAHLYVSDVETAARLVDAALAAYGHLQSDGSADESEAVPA